MTKLTSNANPESIAQAFALSRAVGRKTLTFTYKKSGKVKGGQIFGDDLRLYTLKIVNYGDLVEESKTILRNLSDEDCAALIGGAEGYDSRKKTAALVPVTVDMVIAARDEMLLKLDTAGDTSNSSTKQEHYEPLVVNDKTVNCCRVYIGDKKPADVGSVYISGVCVDSETLVEGAKDPNAKAPRRLVTTVAKNLVGKLLPHNQWVTFKVSNGFNLI